MNGQRPGGPGDPAISHGRFPFGIIPDVQGALFVFKVLYFGQGGTGPQNRKPKNYRDQIFSAHGLPMRAADSPSGCIVKAKFNLLLIVRILTRKGKMALRRLESI
jgi:hypothetical protein